MSSAGEGYNEQGGTGVIRGDLLLKSKNYSTFAACEASGDNAWRAYEGDGKEVEGDEQAAHTFPVASISICRFSSSSNCTPFSSILCIS